MLRDKIANSIIIIIIIADFNKIRLFRAIKLYNSIKGDSLILLAKHQVASFQGCVCIRDRCLYPETAGSLFSNGG